MKTKLYLINGPLGAGKTTLLKQLLKTPELKNARIIENEFASSSVDTAQLHDHQAEIQTIAGVCICCSTGDELTDALTTLAHTLDPVIIEATGVANSLKLVEKIVLADMLDHYDIAQSLFVLDAYEAIANLDTTIKDYTQELRAADVVLLSKVDLLRAGEYETLIGALNAIGVTSTQKVKEGVIDGALPDDGSQILEYFSQLDATVTNHDTNINYAIFDASDEIIDPKKMHDTWDAFATEFLLRRAKGNIIDRNGKKWHVEATPGQCRITEYTYGDTSLVLIGERAREVTAQALRSMR